MIGALKDVNSKSNAKIKKGNDDVIYDFNHTMIEILNKISKQVVVEVKNHLDEKKERNQNLEKPILNKMDKLIQCKKNNLLFEPRMIQESLLVIEEVGSSSNVKFTNYKSSPLRNMDERIIPNNLEMNEPLEKVDPKYILGIIE